MCRKNLNSIQGRVLVQVSPSYAYDKDKVLEHARAYEKEFQKVGVPRDRFCIKILATGPGLNAAKILQEEGIATLGTGIFSVEQAIACSQARCLYISPYYNGHTAQLTLGESRTDKIGRGPYASGHITVARRGGSGTTTSVLEPNPANASLLSATL